MKAPRAVAGKDLFTEILEGTPIPVEKLEYFRARLRLAIYDLYATRFHQQEMKQKEYADRIHKRVEVVNRLLGAPGNWTLDTFSDLMIGLGYMPVIGDESVRKRLAPVETHEKFKNPRFQTDPLPTNRLTMDAKITVTLTAEEAKLVREALEHYNYTEPQPYLRRDREMLNDLCAEFKRLTPEDSTHEQS